MAFNYCGMRFQKNNWQPSKAAHRKAVRHRRGLRRGRDAGTAHFERAFPNEEQPATYMPDARNDLAVCQMFASRPDHRSSARSRAAGAYAFSLADARYRSHIMWRRGGASKRLRFMMLFLTTLFCWFLRSQRTRRSRPGRSVVTIEAVGSTTETDHIYNPACFFYAERSRVED